MVLGTIAIGLIGGLGLKCTFSLAKFPGVLYQFGTVLN